MRCPPGMSELTLQDVREEKQKKLPEIESESISGAVHAFHE